MSILTNNGKPQNYFSSTKLDKEEGVPICVQRMREPPFLPREIFYFVKDSFARLKILLRGRCFINGLTASEFVLLVNETKTISILIEEIQQSSVRE